MKTSFETCVSNSCTALSPAQLLGIIIGRGGPGYTSEMLGLRLLEKFNGLGGLSEADYLSLKRVKGVGHHGAHRIAAACELVKRLSEATRRTPSKISEAGDVYDIVGPQLRFRENEEFVVLLLGGRNELLSTATIAQGKRNFCQVHGASIFREALLADACSIILVHNHPSGDPSPSPEDCSMTRKVVAQGKLLGIQVLDHIIVGESSYCSLREEGVVE